MYAVVNDARIYFDVDGEGSTPTGTVMSAGYDWVTPVTQGQILSPGIGGLVATRQDVSA